MYKSRRVVVEVSEAVHGELRKVAVLNGLRVYQVADALLRDELADTERVKMLIKKFQHKDPCLPDPFCNQ